MAVLFSCKWTTWFQYTLYLYRREKKIPKKYLPTYLTTKKMQQEIDIFLTLTIEPGLKDNFG